MADPLETESTSTETQEAPAQPTETSAENHTETTPTSQENSIDSLPEWAQAEIRNLRKESANYRTRAKETETKTAEQLTAKDAEKEELIQQLGKALGLVQEETKDPEDLVKAALERENAAKAERDQISEQLNTYKREAAVRNAITSVKGTVDTDLLNALLASDNAFTSLDISADDYPAQVATMVAEKLDKHPALIAQAAPKSSGVDTSNTTTNTNKLVTREDLKYMSATEINKLAREGQLTHLMARS